MKMYGVSCSFGSGSVFTWDDITAIFVEAFRCSYICLIYKKDMILVYPKGKSWDSSP